MHTAHVQFYVKVIDRDFNTFHGAVFVNTKFLHSSWCFYTEFSKLGSWEFPDFLFLIGKIPTKTHKLSLTLSHTHTHMNTHTQTHFLFLSEAHDALTEEILKSRIYGHVTYTVNSAKSWASRMSALFSPSSQYSNSMEIPKYWLTSKLAVQNHRRADFCAYLNCWSGRRKIWRNYNISKAGSLFVKSRLYGQFTSEFSSLQKNLSTLLSSTPLHSRSSEIHISWINIEATM